MLISIKSIKKDELELLSQKYLGKNSMSQLDLEKIIKEIEENDG